MFDYLKYYISPLLQVIAAVGIYVSDTYAWAAWAGIASLPVLALLDSILPRDLNKRNMTNRNLADIPVWLGTLLAVALYVLMAWKISQGEMSVIASIGAMASVGWLAVVVGVPATHELYHQKGVIKKFIGTYAQVVYLDSSRHVAHMSGHHLDVATADDCDTAPRGMSLYAFTLNAVVHSTITAFRLESDALEKRGKSRYSLRHRTWRAIIAQIVFQYALYTIGGAEAVVYTIGSVLLARLWIESFNYFQHYGQVRDPSKPIARRHVWNHLGPISRTVTFEITNHADHHLNAYTPYYKLVPDAASVKLPSVFVCFLSALIPPLWSKAIIQPALKEWDLKYASSEERELAKKQNEVAGWPNWFEKAAA